MVAENIAICQLTLSTIKKGYTQGFRSRAGGKGTPVIGAGRVDIWSIGERPNEAIAQGG